VERTSSAATRIGELSEHRSLSMQDQPSGSTALVAELEAEGIDATGLPGDLANRDGVPALIDQLPTPLDPSLSQIPTGANTRNATRSSRSSALRIAKAKKPAPSRGQMPLHRGWRTEHR
jgi:hypothetical protein